MEGNTIGSGATYRYSVEIPAAGWDAGNGNFIIKPAGPVIGLSVWHVGEIPTDPCLWKTGLADAGKTVDSIVRQLLAQKGRHASAPSEVTLDGHKATYLVWSTPADWVVTGDADFRGCDDSGNGHHDYVSWFGKGNGERYMIVAGQVERIWVVDVAGEPLVVSATYAPNASSSDQAELAAVAASIQFDTP